MRLASATRESMWIQAAKPFASLCDISSLWGIATSLAQHPCGLKWSISSRRMQEHSGKVAWST
jgi:hypothetical protein